MKLVERNINERFIRNDSKQISKYWKCITTTEEYYYISEEEKIEHQRQRLLNGWEDSGQVKKTIGNLLNPKPESVWYGRYIKTDVVEDGSNANSTD